MPPEILHLNSNEFRLPEKLRALVIGGSESGKTHFMLQLLRFRNRVCGSHYSKFVYCSPNFKNVHDEEELKDEITQLASPAPVEFFDHIPTVDELQELVEPTKSFRMLIFIDDFSGLIYRSTSVLQMVIRLSSKEAIDLILSCHIALGNKLGPNYQIILNSINTCIFLRSLSNMTALKYIGQNYFPSNPNHLQNCLKAASQYQEGRYSYIILKKKRDEIAMISSNIFPINDEKPPIYFKNP